MKIILTCLMTVLLLHTQDAVFAQPRFCSFTTTKVNSVSPDVSSAPVSYFNGVIKNDRVLLNWAIDNNNQPDRFEVERSRDGKTFVMAALVFGTDDPDFVEYKFYEKAKKVKSFYRLKIIYKDKTVDYSSIINPQPFAESP